jgi:L,D-transpeptidase YbiS
LSKLSLIVDVKSQQLQCLMGTAVQRCYPIATAAKGLGEEKGSFCTPRGWHKIAAKVGAGAPVGAVFVRRRPTGEIYSPALASQYPHRDWILTRILWLSGLEVGKNRRGTVDTLRRTIYIHGCPDEISLGSPSSHGCVRMHSADVIDLFNLVSVGTKVSIV